MDNITHSLFGLATAKIINSKVNKEKDPKVSFFIHFVSIFAANFPDLDLLFAFIDPGIIGYLAHHRGHTHTFIYLIPQALLLWGLSVYFLKIKSHFVRWWGLGAIAINLILHIGLDYQNSYGVHPFHPFNNNWFYRDTLFIIEPLIWFSLLPIVFTPFPQLAMLRQTKNKNQWSKALVWLVLLSLFLGLLFLAYSAQVIGGVSYCICLILFVGLLLLFNHKEVFSKSCIGLVLALTVTTVFSVGRYATLKSLHENYQTHSPQSKLLDVVLSPMPAHPGCWKFILVSTDLRKSYSLEVGSYQQKIFNFWKCPAGVYSNDQILIEDHRLQHQKHAIYLEFTHKADLNTLIEDLGDKNNCKRDEWLQFARTPLKVDEAYEDIRFQSNSRRSFSKLEINDPKVKCLKLKVPWIPPRQDLIDLAHKLKNSEL